MSDPTPTLTMVGHPAPEFLRMVALGAGLRGGVAPALVTFREEFRDEEWAAIEAGDYVAGVKLYRRAGVVGLVVELVCRGSRMQFFLNYSLAHVATLGGAEAVAEIVDGIDQYKREREPGLGLLVCLVFLSVEEPQTVRAMRAFTLPRMFGDRYLEAVLSTGDQALDQAVDIVVGLCGNTSKAWADALPGVAVAGHELELTEGEYVRTQRRSRKH